MKAILFLSLIVSSVSSSSWASEYCADLDKSLRAEYRAGRPIAIAAVLPEIKAGIPAVNKFMSLLTARQIRLIFDEAEKPSNQLPQMLSSFALPHISSLQFIVCPPNTKAWKIGSQMGCKGEPPNDDEPEVESLWFAADNEKGDAVTLFYRKAGTSIMFGVPNEVFLTHLGSRTRLSSSDASQLSFQTVYLNGSDTHERFLLPCSEENFVRANLPESCILSR